MENCLISDINLYHSTVFSCINIEIVLYFFCRDEKIFQNLTVYTSRRLTITSNWWWYQKNVSGVVFVRKLFCLVSRKSDLFCMNRSRKFILTYKWFRVKSTKVSYDCIYHFAWQTDCNGKFKIFSWFRSGSPNTKYRFTKYE